MRRTSFSGERSRHLTAILLAAGVGKRMGAGAPPKCLLSLGGKSLLRITFEFLRAAGVRDVVLVLGYRKEEVRREALAASGGMRISSLENPRYQEGAILSLWTARERLDRDVLIMDSDVLCPQAAFERLVRSPRTNCILVDNSAADTGEEQMVFGAGQRVHWITKRPPDEIRSRWSCFGEAIGFLKLSREAAAVLRELLEERVRQGAVQIEHEQVYPDLFQRVPVGCETIGGLPWTEIDTPEDLKRAQEEILPRWASPPCLNRLLAKAFLPAVLRLPVTPNQWTFLSLVLGLLAVGWIAQGDTRSDLWGALSFQLFYLLDNWDGEVARARGLSSRWGGWFDLAVDTVVQSGLGLALALGLFRQGAPAWVIPLGWAASVGLTLDFLLTAWGKLKGFGPAVYGDPSRGFSARNHWLRSNLTNENFSLLVVLALLAGWRLPFLIVLAPGSHLFWLLFLWRNSRGQTLGSGSSRLSRHLQLLG